MDTVKKKKNITLAVAAALCAASLIIMSAALIFYNRNLEENQKTTFTPPPFEEAAVAGYPEIPEDLDWSEVDAQIYKAYVCSKITVEDGEADIWLMNPENNTVWLKLRMMDKAGNVLGETGILRPGEYVQAVELNTEIDSGESISMKLMGYEPNTYYSAGSVILNTTIMEGDRE